MRVYAASTAGPYHKAQGKENQDWYATQEEAPCLFAGVTDGAGSHENSLEGGKLVLREAFAYLEEHAPYSTTPLEEVLAGAVEHAHGCLLKQAEVKTMGCTLALAVLRGDSWGVIVVGDAFAVLHRGEEDHEVLMPEAVGEFANVTELMSGSTINPVAASGVGNLQALSLSSDGLYNRTTTRGEAITGFWKPLVRQAQEGTLRMEELLSYMEGKDLLEDDTTLVMIVKDW